MRFQQLFYNFAADFHSTRILRGHIVPYFIIKMITNAQIKDIVLQTLAGTDIFVVDASVRPGNRIMVELDRLEGITIDQCADISRAIEKHLNRDAEDFELEVSSPGLTQPFKVKEQYFKNVGKKIEVLLANGNKLKGTLVNMNDQSISLDTEITRKAEGKKKKQTTVENTVINYTDIKSAKVVITF